MRISTSSAQQFGINSILNQQAKLSKTQLQLGSGLKFLSPADDPAAAVRVLDLQQSIEQSSQYQSNIGTARSRLELEETTLTSAGTAVQRARELAVQALNDTNKAVDRLVIEKEIGQILDGLVGLANTKNANGEYLFSGFRSQTPPYSETVTQVTQGGETRFVNLYEYHGDENQRTLQAGPTRRIADGNHGIEVFGRSFDYLGNPPSTINPANPDEGSIFDVVAKLASQLVNNDLDPERITTSGAGMGVEISGSAIDSALVSTAISNQSITITAPDGSTQTHLIDTDGERSAADIALNLNTMPGINAEANPNQVIMDLSNTVGVEDGDTITFNLHGDFGANTAIAFVRDSVANPSLVADFVGAINAAGLGDITATSQNTNQFSINSASGANIGIENFYVQDNASVALSNFAGTTGIGQSVSMTIDGTAISFDGSAAGFLTQAQTSIGSGGANTHRIIDLGSGAISVTKNDGTTLAVTAYSQGAATDQSVRLNASNGGTSVAGDPVTLNGVTTSASGDVVPISQTIDFDRVTLAEGGAADSAFRTSTVNLQLDSDYTIQSDVSGSSASGTYGIFDIPANTAVAFDTQGILDEIDNGMQRILNVRSSIGARLNSLDLQHHLNEDFVLDMESMLSDTQDLDYADAISRFSSQQVALQAAQQAFVRVQDLSLFNYL